MESRIHVNVYIWHLQRMMACFDFTTYSCWGSLKSSHQTYHFVEANHYNSYTFLTTLYGPIVDCDWWYVLGATLIQQTRGGVLPLIFWLNITISNECVMMSSVQHTWLGKLTKSSNLWHTQNLCTLKICTHTIVHHCTYSLHSTHPHVCTTTDLTSLYLLRLSITQSGYCFSNLHWVIVVL